MQQYWINQDGVQAGPVTIEQMEKMSISAKAYVWRSGLEDWVKITELPELADVLQQASDEATASQPAPAPAVQTEPEPAVQEEAAEESGNQAAAQEEPSEPESAATEEDYTGPQPPEIPNGHYQGLYSAHYQNPYSAESQESAEECPPSNLIWSVIAAMCCQPLGIAAIVMSIMVKHSYSVGNYKRACKYSDWSAWACILAFTFGAASVWLLPLEIIMSLS